MNVKKVNGRVIGGNFTAAERKAIDIEIRKAMAEYDRKHAMEMDAIILWTLHKVFGFGPDRLKKFYQAVIPEIDNLLARYEMEDEDIEWLCTKKLKEYGIDLDEWSLESTGKRY